MPRSLQLIADRFQADWGKDEFYDLWINDLQEQGNEEKREDKVDKV